MLGSKLFFLLAHGLLHAIAKNVRPESHGHPHHLRNANLVERQVGAGLGVEEQLQAHANATLVKRREPTYGLSDSNLKIGDISVGFLPGFGEALGPNNATVINEILPKPMSVSLSDGFLYFRIVDFRSLGGISDHRVVLRYRGFGPKLGMSRLSFTRAVATEKTVWRG